MKWVTRDFVHVDRVASPWLIKRFIDREAEFVFVPWGQEERRPHDAIPLALPGAELSPYDEDGSTFLKLLQKYRLDDPALHAMGAIIQAGFDYTLHGVRPETMETEIAVGLLAIAEGLLLREQDDAIIIVSSMPIYDALYTELTARRLAREAGVAMPSYGAPGPTQSVLSIRELLAVNGKAPGRTDR